MALREWFEVNDKRYRVRLRRLQGVMPSAYPSKYSSFDTTDSETAQHSTVQYSTVQYSTVQYSTVQNSTAQDSTTQHSTFMSHAT